MVISTTLIESTEQLMSGRPRSVRVETDTPSNVYYTLDGSTPTTTSLIMVGDLVIPTNSPSIELRFFASNGTDSSPITSKIYQPDLHKVRFPNARVEGNVQDSLKNWGTYGDQGNDFNFRFDGTAGVAVDSPDIDGYPNGFDGTGTGTTRGETDLPKDKYAFRFSTMNAIGKEGPGIGTVPAKVTILPQAPQFPQTTSKVSDRLFNPRALVIYQSYKDVNPNGVGMINRGMFSLENPERSGNGFNTGFDKGNVTGGFVKAVFNPNDSTINYYYRDNSVGRWIISTEKYQPKPGADDLSRTISNPRQGNTVARIFHWIPFHYSRLW